MFSKINVLDENVPEAWQYLIGMYTTGDIITLYAAESFNRTSELPGCLDKLLANLSQRRQGEP